MDGWDHGETVTYDLSVYKLTVTTLLEESISSRIIPMLQWSSKMVAGENHIKIMIYIKLETKLWSAKLRDA